VDRVCDCRHRRSVAGALFAYLKGSVFPDSLGISLSSMRW